MNHPHGETKSANCRADWGDLTLEQRTLPPGEVAAAPQETHMVCLNLETPCTLWKPRDGRPRPHTQVPGDSLLLPAGQPGACRWDTPAHVLHLHLSSTLVQRIGAELGSHSWELHAGYGPDDRRLFHLGMALRAEAETGGAGGTVFVDSLAAALAAHLLTQYGGLPERQAAPAGGLSRAAVRQVGAYVRGNLDGDLTLAGIAAVSGASPFHFARQFKQTTGETLHRFVTRCRVEAAQALLRRGELSVAQVASRAGFAQQSHLAGHLRAATGLSPTEFRRQASSQPANAHDFV